MSLVSRPRRRRRFALAFAVTCTPAAGATGAYLLLLLAAAAVRRRAPNEDADGNPVRIAVVIPAHDEERDIARTVGSLEDSDYPANRCRIIVVADNCSDRTAAVAASAGAEVWERADHGRRGKGYALDWAFRRLSTDGSVDAVCVVDADCEVSSNFLSAVSARLGEGADAVQASYLVSNPEASPAAALRWAGFALFNVIRPAGRDRLGLSSGLLGTGMAVSTDLLNRSPWRAFSFAEDREQHMWWVLAGARVRFAAEARVLSPAAHGAAGRRAQEARWESGRRHLVSELTPRLLRRWMRTGDLASLDAALEPLLPPQSLLGGMNLLAVVASRLSGSQGIKRWALAGFAAQTVYVLGGLAVVKAPAPVWRALISLPWFVGRRLMLLARAVAGRGPTGWERTPRRSEEPSGS